jgi:hypothetical protein
VSGELKLAFHSRDIGCIADLQFDADYPSLFCTLTYANSSKPASKASELAASFGIRSQPVVVNLNRIEIIYSSKWHLQEIAVMIHPRDWRHAPLPTPPEAVREVFMSIESELDLDGRVHIETDVTVTWDKAGQQLAVAAIPAAKPTSWYHLADNLLVGTTSGGRFTELRFTSINIDPGLELQDSV